MAARPRIICFLEAHGLLKINKQSVRQCNGRCPKAAVIPGRDFLLSGRGVLLAHGTHRRVV